MPNTKRRSKTPASERTSQTVAHTAGQLLNGSNSEAAILWLEGLADNPQTDGAAREHAATLLGVLSSIKRVAASALTQR